MRLLHTLDYAVLLPLMARFPLFAGYALSALRGWSNGIIERDWRSMMLEKRHVARQSATGYRMLIPDASNERVCSLVRKRFETESREEFEGRLIVAERVDRLSCTIAPDAFLRACQQRDRGLVLLTPHFDSFILGVVFLGRAGIKINLMSSVGDADSKINPAVYKHFMTKYKHMERYMNGGRVLPMEHGVRAFYQMLERKECLVILADIPPAVGGACVEPLFLGARRSLAGGALRMARKTGSNLGAFVCRYEGVARYRVEGGSVLDASDPLALDTVYGFLSEKIMAAPGQWWAADLLPGMTAVAGAGNLDNRAETP